MYRKTIRIY